MSTSWSLLEQALRALSRSGELPPHIADHDLVPSDDLDALGLDSMAKLALVTGLEARTGILLGGQKLLEASTLGDLVALMDQARN